MEGETIKKVLSKKHKRSVKKNVKKDFKKKLFLKHKNVIGISVVSLIVGILLGTQLNFEKPVDVKDPLNWKERFSRTTIGMEYDSESGISFNKEGAVSIVQFTKKDGTEYIQRYFDDGRLRMIWTKSKDGIVTRTDFYEDCIFCPKWTGELDKNGVLSKMTKYDRDGKITSEEKDLEKFSCGK